MPKREVIHLLRRFKRWGGEGTGTLCNRMALSDDGMNLSDIREEVTCKFCLKQIAALKLRAANEAKQTGALNETTL